MKFSINLVIALLISCTATAFVFAGVPQTINHQGYLTGSNGAPINSPLGVPMVFSLYSSSPARNNPVWREPMKLVPVTNGIYSTRIGSVTPITAPFDVPYYLGVKVDSDPEMPLQPLTSAGYAFRAGVAEAVIPGAANSGVTPWSTTAASNITATANTGYMLTGSGTTMVNLPTNAAVGDVIRIYSQGTGGYSVTPGGSQVIAGATAYQYSLHDSPRGWQALASSADGMKLAAVVSNGQIYTSGNGGGSWTPRETARNWYDIASSSDGSKLVAVVYTGQIYTSTDSGVTWTARDSVRDWNAVVSSADGSKLAATAYGGSIYTSTDSGVSWTAQGTPDWWHSLASSADGSRLVASTESGGQIYTSINGGVNWTVRGSFGGWVAVTSSADGTKLAAASYDGFMHVSTDSGATWSQYGVPRSWMRIVSSADGSRLVATVDGGGFSLSSDYGLTWTPRDTSLGGTAVAISADGSRFVVASPGSYICTGLLSVKGTQSSSAELIYLGNGKWGVNQSFGNFVAKNGDSMTGPLALPVDGLNVGNGQLVAYNGAIGVGTLPGYGFALDVIGAGRFSGAVSLPTDGMSLGGSQLVTSGGNVGIGTASPTNKLDVVGNAKITGTLTTGNLIVSPPAGNGSSAANASESCKTLKSTFPSTVSGIYWLDPDGGSTANAFQAYCNMTTSGGGWTLVSTLKYPFPASGIGETTGQVTTSGTAWMDQVRYRKLLAVSSEFMAAGDTGQIFATLNDGLSGTCQSLITPKPFYVMGTTLLFTYGFSGNQCNNSYTYYTYAGIDLSASNGIVAGNASNNPIVSSIWRSVSSSGSYLTSQVTIGSGAANGLFLYVR